MAVVETESRYEVTVPGEGNFTFFFAKRESFLGFLESGVTCHVGDPRDVEDFMMLRRARARQMLLEYLDAQERKTLANENEPERTLNA
jgi:hypothetical protein